MIAAGCIYSGSWVFSYAHEVRRPGRRVASGCWDNVRGESLVSGGVMLGDPVSAHTGDGCADQRRTLERVFDFGKLDAVAANLDLGVGATEEFDGAVGR